ncbi:MAG: phosphatase PAP2 family protein [Candidatus Krumholzibacteria bacterium]|nr:phosphatase PAP2 family protein [Candidatus Krumholzibacteria bacterium]
MSRQQGIALDFAIPLTILVVGTAVFWTTDLDLALQARFHVPGEGWPVGREQPWQGLYDFGVIPAWVLALGALGVLVASIWRPRYARHRRAAGYFVLAMAVGPGLLVNNVFKQNWGRPRPKDLAVFESVRAQPYVRVWVKGPPERGNSFASGHAATAFFLMTPFLVLRRRALGTALAFLIVGLAYGSLMGVARMAQGAHFASDALWAGGFVYLSALVVYYALGLDGEQA